jgi:hypothetical protein
MKLLLLIILAFGCSSCHDNRMMQTPQLLQQEASRRTDSTIGNWERVLAAELEGTEWKEIRTIEAFIARIKTYQPVKRVFYTRAGFVYIAIPDNGKDQTVVATYHCRLAKRLGLGDVKGIKVVDEKEVRYFDNGTASGRELGISICNFINP